MTPNPPTHWHNDPTASARLALSCLDLTSLNDQDTEADIAGLCERAQGRFGQVAAVCVWPRLAAFARTQLPAAVSVAAVANFPDGNADLERVRSDVGAIVQAGAQEVDLVLPYTQLRLGDEHAVMQILEAARKACPGLLLKVILETGELVTDELISRASLLALQAGADFLKTSTGKTPVSATPQAARIMLGCIAQVPQVRDRVGFKPSGGIRTVADATTYMTLVEEHLGAHALTPQRFRIGASGILNDIEAILGGSSLTSPPPPGY